MGDAVLRLEGIEAVAAPNPGIVIVVPILRLASGRFAATRQ